MTMLSGVVESYDDKKGFGYLRRSDVARASRVWFHITKCNIERPPPLVGEVVSFQSVVEEKGLTATTVVRKNARSPSVPDANPSVDVKEAGAKHTVADVPAARQLAPVKDKYEELARAPSVFKGGSHPRYVYVDLDNIQRTLETSDHLVGLFPGAATTRDLRLDLRGLTRRFAEGSAGGAPSRLVAFYFNTSEAIAAQLRGLSYGGVAWDVRKQETRSDTSMQLELLNSKQPCNSHPKTLVLVTGDGNFAPSNGMCFRDIMDKYLRDGWYVEVHAWMCSMATKYIDYQKEYPNEAWIRPLDDERVGEVVYTRSRARGTMQSAPAVSRKQDKQSGKPSDSNWRGSSETKPTRRSQLRTVSNKAAEELKPMSHETGSHETMLTLVDDGTEDKRSTPADDGSEEKRATEVDDGSEEKMPIHDDTDDADDEHDNDYLEFFDRRAFTLSLMREVGVVRLGPTSTQSTLFEMPAIEPAADADTGSEATYRPDQYKTLIDQIEGPDGELFIPTAITMLKGSNALADLSTIQEADTETQRGCWPWPSQTKWMLHPGASSKLKTHKPRISQKNPLCRFVVELEAEIHSCVITQ